MCEEVSGGWLSDGIAVVQTVLRVTGTYWLEGHGVCQKWDVGLWRAAICSFGRGDPYSVDRLYARLKRCRGI